VGLPAAHVLLPLCASSANGRPPRGHRLVGRGAGDVAALLQQSGLDPGQVLQQLPLLAPELMQVEEAFERERLSKGLEVRRNVGLTLSMDPPLALLSNSGFQAPIAGDPCHELDGVKPKPFCTSCCSQSDWGNATLKIALL